MKTLVELRRKAGYPLKSVLMSNNDDVSARDDMWLRSNLESLEYFEPSEDEEDLDDDEDDDWGENESQSESG